MQLPLAAQQPSGHELAEQEHVPCATLQDCPLAQLLHALPAPPQAASELGVHWPAALQQPLGHDSGVQTHTPESHACPGSHTLQLTPATPHEAGDWTETQF